MISINNLTYEIIEDEREGYNEEAFKARYSEILTKYDYIVGDWGYGQLRLRGFFDDSEYLYEYCNFGCPYFVAKKIKK